MSYASIQIYDNYLSLYAPKKSTRFDKHDRKELTAIYGRILQSCQKTPFYILDTTQESQRFAIQLKESARDFSHNIAALGNLEDGTLFSRKSAYSSDESIATIEHLQENQAQATDILYELRVHQLASPQKNASVPLLAKEPVGLEANSYSFDIDINHIQYELQFHIKDKETNEELQAKIVNLINRSDLGLKATLKASEQDMTYLEITSCATGLPRHGEEHFKISDYHTSYQKGVVNYLGLNRHYTAPTNAIYELNGQRHTSYSNTITIDNAYEITLHRTNPKAEEDSVIIGLVSDTESMNSNIREFVDSYNSFLRVTDEYKDTQSAAAPRLRKEMHHMLSKHEKNIAKLGIIVNADDTLSYSPQPAGIDSDAFYQFGKQLLEKLDTISLNPMEYVNMRVCIYKNPANTLLTPYVTSTYSGMLFNTYC